MIAIRPTVAPCKAIKRRVSARSGILQSAKIESVSKHSTLILLAIAALATAGCKSLPPPMPLSQLNPQQAHGHDLFQARCGACHYDRKDSALHGPSLLGVYKKPSLPSGAAATDERVNATIMHGRGLMPALGNSLDQQDADDILAYLHTL
jgi:mono/diheme cytochrome c family protein